MESLVIPLLLVALSVDSSSQSLDFFSSTKFEGEINAERGSWKASDDFLSSTPWSQIMLMANGTMPTARGELLKLRKPLEVSSEELQRKIPREFDARKRWGKKCPTIGEVLDQGGCSSGWAINPAAAFSDRFCIETKGKHKARFSGAHVLYCDDLNNSKCTKGGYDLWAWLWIKKFGIPTGGVYGSEEGCEPYNIPPSGNGNFSTKCQKQCTNENYKKSLDDDLKYVQSYYVFMADEHENVQRNILKNGPMTATLTIYKDFLNYKSGVYDASENSYNQRLGEHTVKVIGWGVEEKVPYWLVQNSWGKEFGQDGLIKIKRDSRIWDYFAYGVPITKTVKSSEE